VEGGAAKLLTPGNFEVEHVVYSADGKEAVYSSNQDDIDRWHTGLFDIHLAFALDDEPRDPGSPRLWLFPPPRRFFAAVQEQLGLKLSSGTGPIDVLVIDHVERPSEN